MATRRVASRCRRGGALLLLGALSTGCNQYELFRVSGFAQESYTNDAEILFVIDNSASMQEESLGLANNFDVFVRQLTDPGQGGYPTNDLGDAVDNYVDYVRDRESFVDYRLGVVTTDVSGSYGALLGDPPVLDNADADVGQGFIANLLCDATCFTDSTAVPSDPSYTCGEPSSEVTRELLDCTCGEGAWVGNCAQGGDEEGLEAVFMAMCRAVESPPAACFEDNQFTQADVQSNAGLLREHSHVIPVLVTDEGDSSRRVQAGRVEIDEYLALFSRFGHPMSWAVIGPSRGDASDCTELAADWGVARYEAIADATGGLYVDIAEPAGDGCRVTDFAAALEQLGALLGGLLDSFPLRGVPDVDTILVFVEGDPVEPSTLNDDGSYTDGWQYVPEDNAVVFHGDAVPDYNEEVRIYYLPLSGMPRDLPFLRSRPGEGR